jgi:hypothetical protein
MGERLNKNYYIHKRFQPNKEFLFAHQNVVGMFYTVKRNNTYRPAANDVVAQTFNPSVAWIEWQWHLIEHKSIDNDTQSIWLLQAIQSVIQSAIGLGFLSDAGNAYAYSLSEVTPSSASKVHRTNQTWYEGGIGKAASIISLFFSLKPIHSLWMIKSSRLWCAFRTTWLNLVLMAKMTSKDFRSVSAFEISWWAKWQWATAPKMGLETRHQQTFWRVSSWNISHFNLSPVLPNADAGVVMIECGKCKGKG